MGRSRYKQIVDALAVDIRTGRLRPATRLPTHRKLAQTHSLALATASRVYAELEGMGLVVGEMGRGTFVRDQSYSRGLGADLQAAAEGAIDLSFSEPTISGQADLLREIDVKTSGEMINVHAKDPHSCINAVPGGDDVTSGAAR